MEQPKTMLVRDHRYPERILLFGPGGVGKTTAVGTIAAYDPSAHMWVIDTDVSFAYQRLIWTEVPFTEDQWTIFEVGDWDDFTKAMDTVLKDGDPNKDWLIIDNITWCWVEVQSWFSDQVHGVDIDDFLISVRKSVKGDRAEVQKAIAENTNWDIINKTYNRKVNAMLHKWRGNLICVAEADETVKKDGDNRDTGVYTPFGLKPRGQKGIHYTMRTTILLKKNKKGDYAMYSIKDQGREDMDGMVVTTPDDGGFAVEYLKEVAGWSMKKSTRK